MSTAYIPVTSSVPGALLLLETIDDPAELAAIIDNLQEHEAESVCPIGEMGLARYIGRDTKSNNSSGNNSMSLLMTAAKFGRVQCCSMLLRRYPQSRHDKNSRKYNALHFSSYEGHQDVSLMLLAAGINPFDLNKYGETSDEAALNGGYFKLSNLLKLEALCPLSTRKYYTSHDTALSKSSFVNRCCNLDLVRCLAASQWAGDASRPCTPIPFDYTHGAAYGAEQCVAGSTIFAKHTDIGNTRKFYLECVSCDPGADATMLGSTIELGFSSSASINSSIYVGRGSCNQIRLTDMSISKRHASLSFHAGLGFYVKDLGSVHGTFLDGVRLLSQMCIATGTDADWNNQHLFLTENSVLKLGRLTLVLRKRIEPTVLSDSFVPNVNFGIRLLEETKRRHSLERIEKANAKKHSQSVEAVSRKNQNRLLIERGNCAATANESEDPSVSELLTKQVDGKAFGATMLQRMGWEPGKGLGKVESGISDFIRVNARVARAGIGSEEEHIAGSDSNYGGDRAAKIRKITAQRYELARNRICKPEDLK